MERGKKFFCGERSVGADKKRFPVWVAQLNWWDKWRIRRDTLISHSWSRKKRKIYRRRSDKKFGLFLARDPTKSDDNWSLSSKCHNFVGPLFPNLSRKTPKNVSNRRESTTALYFFSFCLSAAAASASESNSSIKSSGWRLNFQRLGFLET